MTKKLAEESLFPALVDPKLLRLDETCGVCLGDFNDDVVPASPSPSGVHSPQDPAKEAPDVLAISDTEKETELQEKVVKNEDPLRDIGLLTGCTHTYHFFCIEKWGKQRENTCPQCKSRFSWIGRYSRSGQRLCCSRVGLKHQKNTTEVTIADYLQQQQHQELCQICSTMIDTSRELLRCSDQLCLNSFHFICAGFDALPTRTWFCPQCRTNGICRDPESRRIPSNRISADGFLLPPRPRGRRAALAAAEGDQEQQQERERQELIESLSNAVVRRINRRARQHEGEEDGQEEAPRRRASRARRGSAAASATTRRRGRNQQQLQQQLQAEGEDVSHSGTEGEASSSAAIDYRRLGRLPSGAAAAMAAAATTASAVVHPERTSDLGATSEAPRMLRFYLGSENAVSSRGSGGGPLGASPPRSNSWLLQRKLDVIRLRQERREALRRQETLRRMEEQAKVVCNGVSIENPSGAALVEDLLQHHDQLVRMHRGDRQSRRDTPMAASQPSDLAEKPEIAECVNKYEHHHRQGREEAPLLLPDDEQRKKEEEGGGADDGCSILASKCEELLREEAQRRSDVSDDMVRAQILLDIDRARTKFCNEAAEAAALKHHCNKGEARVRPLHLSYLVPGQGGP